MALLMVSTLLYLPGFGQDSDQFETKAEIGEFTAQLDSLDGDSAMTADSMRVELYNKLALSYANDQLDSSWLFIGKAFELSKGIGNKDLEAVTHYNSGRLWESAGLLGKAEESYLTWLGIRKTQDEQRYRWALSGMRSFYSGYNAVDELKTINDAWVELIDSQLALEIVPKYSENHYYNAVLEYQQSIEPVYFSLIDLGRYEEAEYYFLHMLDQCQTFHYWLQGDMLYFHIERWLLAEGNAERLGQWYVRWFNTLENYVSDQSIAKTTLLLVNRNVLNYFEGDAWHIKNYLAKIADKIQGDTGVYQLTVGWAMNKNNTVQEQLNYNILAWESGNRIGIDEFNEDFESQVKTATKNYVNLDTQRHNDLLAALVSIGKSTTNKKTAKACTKAMKKLSK